ncbi:unnamed protein product [Ostreobium quekettii]|uniref:Uncharacterized protein n=1 Tax=Ostreobium quekettii TaxID=121088 RepID=A0A8S1J7K8_9CHLO|nr:unnamed protein product [Ostreobium quekettii]
MKKWISYNLHSLQLLKDQTQRNAVVNIIFQCSGPSGRLSHAAAQALARGSACWWQSIHIAGGRQKSNRQDRQAGSAELGVYQSAETVIANILVHHIGTIAQQD